MTENSDVAGLVLHFRTPERTLACLSSLHEQGIGHVVVVDNSQDDGTSVTAMTQGLGKLHARGLHVDMLQATRNLGFSSGVNAGLAHIHGQGSQHVLLINSDATLAAGALSSMVSMLSSAALVAPCTLDGPQMARRAPTVFYQPHFALFQRHTGMRAIGYPSGCCLLIRQDQVRQDLFDSDFFFYGEDVMLGHTLRQRAVNVAECMDAVVIHAGTVSAKNGSLFYEYHMARAHWLLARKLACNRGERMLFASARCITLPLRALLRCMRWQSLNPWRGLWMASVDLIFERCRDLTPLTSPISPSET